MFTIFIPQFRCYKRYSSLRIIWYKSVRNSTSDGAIRTKHKSLCDFVKVGLTQQDDVFHRPTQWLMFGDGASQPGCTRSPFLDPKPPHWASCRTTPGASLHPWGVCRHISRCASVCTCYRTENIWIIMYNIYIYMPIVYILYIMNVYVYIYIYIHTHICICIIYIYTYTRTCCRP